MDKSMLGGDPFSGPWQFGLGVCLRYLSHLNI